MHCNKPKTIEFQPVEGLNPGLDGNCSGPALIMPMSHKDNNGNIFI